MTLTLKASHTVRLKDAASPAAAGKVLWHFPGATQIPPAPLLLSTHQV
jgi:hypothetical protein